VSSRWRPSPRQLAQVVFGLTIFGIGDGLITGTELGNSPWTVFAEGVSVHTPLSIGEATLVIGAVVLLSWVALSERPGLGTVLNIVVIAGMIDVTLWALPDHLAVGTRWALLFGGIALVGVGSGFYLHADLGPGPRDGLMTSIHARTGWPIFAVRTGIESTAVAIGWVLGGTVGAGSLLFALLIGPAVGTALRVTRPARDAAPSPTAGRTAPGRPAPASAPRD
jgi:uncharacterized membrane protein YczE